ncbi:MATE family efflux transporter [Parafilimonas terrae]|uniref:Multidrug-efflux transporter n=1 Tax=Parafilimonas terrae TaxID=1465490 RepID=A0A1I5WPD7_9BACT|nr:MATE family efflux transporter [Parafilimonas terrae]SFQ21368.1 putative efflux protein, MATE family [Parafilimonas terrae]
MLKRLTYKSKEFLTLAVSSIKGVEMDYTQGSLRKAIIMLAIPMILEMSMESVFALVDLFFVGHLPDAEHTLQSVSLTESVLSIIYSIAFGLSMAATAVVSRRTGEKNADEAAHSAVQSLWLACSIAIILSILGVVFADDVLRAMGADEKTVAIGTAFARIDMGSAVIIMLLFLINGIFRGAGDASMAMKSLWLANIFNIILCPVLIRGFGPIPALGLTGAAIATTAGRGIGVCYQLYHLFKGDGIIKIQRKHFNVDWSILKSLINIAAPAVFQFIIASCSWVVLARLVADTGHSVTSAGYQTALRVVVFFILPAWGLSNAAATLVGQNLGAKQLQRAEESVIKTAKYNGVFMGLVSLIFLLGAYPVISFFTNDEAVKEIAVKALRIMASGYIFYGIGMVMANAFNGAGDSWTPTWINLAGFWFFQIPLAYLLTLYFGFGPTGVFVSIPVAETLITIVAWYFFRRGGWKKVKV